MPLVWALVLLLVAAACGPAPTAPLLGTTTPVEADVVSADGALLLDVVAPPPDAARPPAGDNAYVCRCHIVVSPFCPQGWCGSLGTGTRMLPDGSCDLGERGMYFCAPPDLDPASAEAPPWAHWPSYQELDADCRYRIGWTIGVGARRVTGDGCTGAYELRSNGSQTAEGPCALQWACAAALADGTVQTEHVASCDRVCPYIDLARPPPNYDWNLDTVTYVAAGNQWACNGAQSTPATPRVCRP